MQVIGKISVRISSMQQALPGVKLGGRRREQSALGTSTIGAWLQGILKN